MKDSWVLSRALLGAQPDGARETGGDADVSRETPEWGTIIEAARTFLRLGLHFAQHHTRYHLPYHQFADVYDIIKLL